MAISIPSLVKMTRSPRSFIGGKEESFLLVGKVLDLSATKTILQRYTRPPRPPPPPPPPPHHHRHRHLFALFQYSIFKRFSASFLTRRSRETTGLLGETTSNANIFTNDFKFYRFLLENSLFNTNHDLNLLVLSEIA